MSITRINNNVSAMSATRRLNITGGRLAQNIERLSSGLRINHAGDDAAGLTIRERLRTQIRGTDMAIRNAQDGMSMANTTEASLDSLVSSLQRIRELAIQAGNTGTNDAPAIQSIQDEVFQQIDEINRIASTARFSSRLLFTGDNANVTQVKAGQDQVGVRVSADPTASNLRSGTSILNIIRTKEGSENLLPSKNENGHAIYATGVKDTVDIAVTRGRFLRGANAAAAADPLNTLTIDGVTIAGNDTIAFQGVLSDGVTPFAGSLSVTSGGSTRTMTELIQQIQAAIDNAETALFGGNPADIPASFVQTHVSLPDSALAEELGSGRIRFLSARAAGTTVTTGADIAEAPSYFQIHFSVINDAGQLKHQVESTRDFVEGRRVGGQYGNRVQGITGSTFDTGLFRIEVTDVLPPNRRKVETQLSFRDTAGSIITRNTTLAGKAVLNGTFVGPVFTYSQAGIPLQVNDTITVQGTNADGSTFQTVFTITADAGADADLGDGRINTLGGLIDELNNRDRTAGVNAALNQQSGFVDAKLTLTGNGTLQLIDDIAEHSQSSLFLIVNGHNPVDGSKRTLTDRAQVLIAGNPEEATVSIDGGPRQRVRTGDQVLLSGPTPTRFQEPTPRLMMRIGAGQREAMEQAILSQGADTVEIEAQEFVGRLNGGPAVTFQNGDRNVFFESGESSGVAETLMLDFDVILDIPGPSGQGTQTGYAVLLSTVNQALNFQVGPFKGQDLRLNIPDLRADNIGFGRGSGMTVSDINITTVSGVNQALEIVDAALDQISRTRSQLGAFTNRLETTIDSLSVNSENLRASESRLSDVDLASEVSDFTANQILFQAGTSVLAQANFLPQGLLALLGQ
ncbi:MAG TPA: flagellin [bacterium]|nr:flagellin [bacterium]HOL95361.1 flagellin [bacterium]HPP02310.1 flagellin [bacterium]